jgi:2-methylcitrate dehydratase PrpD
MSTARLVDLLPTTATPEALHIMRLSLLDWLACGRAGTSEPVSRAMRNMAQAEAGASQATPFGGGQLPARATALINGATSHALDYDDTHFAHIGHPSVAVVSAALAVGEWTNASMNDVVLAALNGCELSIRTGVLLGRAHYQIGFHQTATAGAFGAAYAAALLLHKSPEHHHVALSLASTRAAGLKSQFGTMGKPYNAGIAASNGVEAAILAASLTAADHPFEGPNGFLQTHHADGTWDQPDGWMMRSVSHKFHACCHGLHASLEAMAQLDVTADRIREITVFTHPSWLTVCNLTTPSTALEAKFSYAQVLAMAALGYDTADLSSYTDHVTQDPKVRALRERVVVKADETLSETATRIVILQEGIEPTHSHHDIAQALATDTNTLRVRKKAAVLIGQNKADNGWSLLSSPNTSASEFAKLLI